MKTLIVGATALLIACSLSGCTTVVSFHSLGSEGAIVGDEFTGTWYSLDEEDAERLEIGAANEDGWRRVTLPDAEETPEEQVFVRVVKHGDSLLFDASFRAERPAGLGVDAYLVGRVERYDACVAFEVLFDRAGVEAVREAGLAMVSREPESNDDEDAGEGFFDFSIESGGDHLITATPAELRDFLAHHNFQPEALLPFILVRQPLPRDEEGNVDMERMRKLYPAALRRLDEFNSEADRDVDD